MTEDKKARRAPGQRTYHVDDETHATLVAKAAEFGISVSGVLRMAVRQWMAAEVRVSSQPAQVMPYAPPSREAAEAFHGLVNEARAEARNVTGLEHLPQERNPLLPDDNAGEFDVAVDDEGRPLRPVRDVRVRGDEQLTEKPRK